MHPDVVMLLSSAVVIAFLHTMAGPDHYIPFVALAQARNWTLRRTLFWTLVCGLGHVGSSVVLGLAGAVLGWSVSGLQLVQEIRGGLAGWALFFFGLAYTTWGLLQLRRNKRHKHFDTDEDGALYVFEHRHGQAMRPQERHRVTPWVMFVIFLLGPCEPMIPLLFTPAANASWTTLLLLIVVYTLITLATMMGMVMAGFWGVGVFKWNRPERYMHPLGGLTILGCGLGIVAFNW